MIRTSTMTTEASDAVLEQTPVVETDDALAADVTEVVREADAGLRLDAVAPAPAPRYQFD